MSCNIQSDFLLHEVIKGDGDVYLKMISNVATEHRGSEMKLKNLEQFRFTVGTLEDTSYEDDMLQEWEQFYLPDHMFMQVFGVIKKFPCDSPSGELVFMVCEDGKIYAYEDNHLHLVAQNMKELFQQGVEFPGKVQYHRGQSFEDVTEEQWDEAKNSQEFTKVMEEHKEMLKSMKTSYLSDLEIIRQIGTERGFHGNSFTCCPELRSHHS